jgi:sortase A
VPAALVESATTAGTLPGAGDTAGGPSSTESASAPPAGAAVTTSTAATGPRDTEGATTIVQLPTPAPPPEPRADEPLHQVGTIEIPSLGISKPMYEGITLNTLDQGPGHWPGTAMPGQMGNVVIAGHRTSHDHPFRDIDKLKVGDQVVFSTDAGRFVYRVTGTTIVAPNAMYIVDQTSTATATLFACHPPGSTKQRIVVSLALVTS